jgi:hypothetical protein
MVRKEKTFCRVWLLRVLAMYLQKGNSPDKLCSTGMSPNAREILDLKWACRRKEGSTAGELCW